MAAPDIVIPASRDRPRRAPLQQLLWPRGFGNSASDHGGRFVLSRLDLQAVHRNGHHAAGRAGKTEL